MPIAGIIVLGIAMAIGRFTVPGHALSYAGSYEAFAHIGVGVLISVIVLRPGKLRRAAAWTLFAISLLEVVMFLGR